ncbi:MAG TPA: LON peptidase substrate-binding domain-containing protein [Candidatus Dormibacteraeota bacterium]
MAVRIPLFPLGLVLFPHMPLPLHIFEERYRAMIRDCQDQGTGFGVVAIREGIEVGSEASPHPVGTLAQLRKVEPLADGRFNILVVGASRYRITGLSNERPYLLADVDYLEDSAGDEGRAQKLAAQAGAAFVQYANTLRRLADEPPAEMELPDDPELLSYLVAATLQVENRHKQPLLELDAADDRLQGCLDLLRRESVLLARQLAHRAAPLAAVSAN